MIAFFQRFSSSWLRKLIALTCAVFIWFLVEQTITITKTIYNVPVRIINLPPGKTVSGILPNHLLKKRIALTMTGSKSLINSLYSNDIEIVIDAKGKNESWIASIDKKMLTILKPDIDTKNQIHKISANNLFITLTNLVTEEIPIIIKKPIGEAPKGYQFLDVWPQLLMQKVTGPEDQLNLLKQKGLEITFDLNQISKEDLDVLRERYVDSKSNEISFFVPNAWKKVSIPFKDPSSESLNDPRAEFLRINFLKQELIPLGVELPISLFFPIQYSQTLNPLTCSLALNEIVKEQNGLKLLTIPLYVQNVSRFFLKTVRNHLQLTFIVTPKKVQDPLNWTLEFINIKQLENTFVKVSLEENREKYKTPPQNNHEEYLRNRFHNYIRQLELFTQKKTPLHLKAQIEDHAVVIQAK